MRVTQKSTLRLIVVLMLALAGLPQLAAQEGEDHLRQTERVLTELYDRISPSVVTIRVDQRIGGQFTEWSGGSGFVIDTSGHIVTNYHVVESADRVVVRFQDGTTTEGEVIGLDPFSDVAVVFVDLPPEDLIPLEFGDSNKVRVGQFAIALGSPWGQDWTMTTGIVSALNRQITSLSEFDIGAVIQTDTAINPGNSGGPLLNLDGEVIGVNTQILSERRANSGVGFAVPSNLVRRAANDLIEFGEVSYGFLGIEGDDVDLDIILDLDLPNNFQGVVVVQVNPGTPASRAGINVPRTNSLRSGEGYESADIIIAINDNPITSVADLLAYIAANTRPGDTVKMTIQRDGELLDIDLTLGSR